MGAVRGLGVGDCTLRGQCGVLSNGHVPCMGVRGTGAERLAPFRCGTKQAASRHGAHFHLSWVENLPSGCLPSLVPSSVLSASVILGGKQNGHTEVTPRQGARPLRSAGAKARHQDAKDHLHSQPSE